MPTRYVENPLFAPTFQAAVLVAINKRSFEQARAVRRLAQSRSSEVAANVVAIPARAYGKTAYRGAVGVARHGHSFIGVFFERGTTARYARTYKGKGQRAPGAYRGVMNSRPFIVPVAEAFARIPLQLNF